MTEDEIRLCTLSRSRRLPCRVAVSIYILMIRRHLRSFRPRQDANCWSMQRPYVKAGPCNKSMARRLYLKDPFKSHV